MSVKAWVDAWVSRGMERIPLHEQDQILKASETYRGTARGLWRLLTGRSI